MAVREGHDVLGADAQIRGVGDHAGGAVEPCRDLLGRLDHSELLGSDAERNASLGLDLLRRGNVAEAANAFERSLTAQDAAESRYWRALIALEAQTPAAALEHLDRAIAAEPADGRFHLARGRCLSRLGRYQDAAAAFERTLEIWPGSAETIELLEQARASSP